MSYWEKEALGHYADHSPNVLRDPKGPADDGRIGPESGLPEIVTQDGHRGSACCFIRRVQCSSQEGRSTQDFENGSRHLRGGDRLSASVL